MMKVDEVENLLRHYRHDWMNQLQLVYGYATMDKMELVKEKLQHIIAVSREESKLMSLKAPRFSLWVVQFREHYNQFHMTYHVDSSLDLSAFDQSLVHSLNQLMSHLKQHVNELNLYEIEMSVTKGETPIITLGVSGDLNAVESLKSEIQPIQFVKDIEITDRQMLISLLLK
ncbi:Spo0B domain-containing protein [Pontibacillus chungwhensis]|nr:Spo0B domain-containing protein [Pontibacillus chungwhensis]